MAFDVSALTAYVNEQSTALKTAAQFASETAGYANVQTGVKSSEALQILNVTATPQDGSGCSFNALGSSTFTQRNIVTGAVKYQDTLCPKALQTKWTQLFLKKGQRYSEADIPAQIVSEIVKLINKNNETADWMGDTASGNPVLARYDGLIKIITGATGVVSSASGAAAMTTANIRAAFRTAITNIPAALQGDPRFTFFVGYDICQMYVNALGIDNLYHISGQQDAASFGSVQIENSIYKMKAVHGLDGQNATTKIIAVGMNPDNNLYMGVDMLNEEESADMWFSQDDRDVKYDFSFRRGWQVAFPTEIVKVVNS